LGTTQQLLYSQMRTEIVFHAENLPLNVSMSACGVQFDRLGPQRVFGGAPQAPDLPIAQGSPISPRKKLSGPSAMSRR
jgi:hypothetical protein